MRYFMLISLAITLAARSSEVFAFDQAAYKSLEEKSFVRPVYPRSKLKLGQAGFVEVEAIVNSKGEVEFPVVVYSTHQSFEKPAIDAMKKYHIVPAQLSEKAIPSRYSKVIAYEMEGQFNTATKRFKKLYSRAEEKLASPNSTVDELQSIINQMYSSKDLSIYGLVYIAYLEFHLANKLGSLHDQKFASRKLLVILDDYGDFNILKGEQVSLVRKRLVKVLLELGFYSEAFHQFEVLKKQDQDSAKTLKPFVEKAEKYLQLGKPYKQSIVLDKRGNEFSALSGNEIYVEDIKGDIQNLHFRCQAKYEKLKFNQENNYRVPKSWGNCLLQIEGAPRTEAKLIQMGKGSKFEEVSASSQKKD